MTQNKLICTWCENEAITTVVQMPACEAHHDEYHQRQQAGEAWATIEQDFWRQRQGRTVAYQGLDPWINNPGWRDE